LMPDAHLGYGLPIGGVLAVENAVIPYAVGVDIACRMKLSVLDIEPLEMTKNPMRFETALQRGTRFGIGSVLETPQDHRVMDQDWSITRTTREKKDTARKQLGTSGSGNHFVEFGTLTLAQADAQLGLQAGVYTALLSHSGSRGTGASVCSVYSNIARAQLPKNLSTQFGYLGWLSLESQAGQEYWEAMNLMGDYAAANHDVIHRLVTKLLGGRVIAGVENHHNFAWKEIHQGKEWVVHRNVCIAWRWPVHEPNGGQEPVHLERGPYELKRTRNSGDLSRCGRGSGGLQRHPFGDGSSGRIGRYDRPIRS